MIAILQRRLPRRLIPAAALALALAAAAAAPAAAAPLDKKLQKKIAVMEMVINEMLRESPNLLIWGSEPTSSIYLDEFGIIFAFEASLVSKDKDDAEGIAGLEYLKELSKKLGGLRIESDGDRITVIRDEDEDGDTNEDADSTSLEKLLKDRETRLAARYDAGREEMLETLMDYGDTLDQLRGDQYVVITALLKNHQFFQERGVSRLLLKAKVSDLQQMAAGRISRQELKDRIAVEEY